MLVAFLTYMIPKLGKHGTVQVVHLKGIPGLSFAICMDSFNPFSRDTVSYSTCPMFLEVLNLPQHLRRLAGSVTLTGLIPGPHEPKNTDPYVDVLVDDILHLNTLAVYDGYKEDSFSLKASVVLNILDYVGLNKVLHC